MGTGLNQQASIDGTGFQKKLYTLMQIGICFNKLISDRKLPFIKRKEKERSRENTIYFKKYVVYNITIKLLHPEIL